MSGLFVPLVGAQRIERANAENTDYRTKDIGLLEVEIDQLLGLFFHKLERVPDVCDRQAVRKPYRFVEAVRRKTQAVVCLFRSRIQHHWS